MLRLGAVGGLALITRILSAVAPTQGVDGTGQHEVANEHRHAVPAFDATGCHSRTQHMVHIWFEIFTLFACVSSTLQDFVPPSLLLKLFVQPAAYLLSIQRIYSVG